MSFWKDLLGDLYVDPNERSPNLSWGRLEGESENLNINGVMGFSETPPQKYNSTRKAPAEEIAAIIQNRTRAFNIFDITPSLLTRQNYATLISAQDLYGKFGYEDDSFTTGQGTAGWRTVELATAGTFLKIEFLPGQINIPYDPALAPNPENYRKNLDLPTDTVSAGIGNQTIVIQFDDPKSPLIVARHGDTFKVPFERVFVTCKMYVPRFSIITGYNAEIVTNYSKQVANQDIAFGPGHGLFETPHKHAVPFVFTNNFPNTPTGAGTQVSAATTVTNVLIDQGVSTPVARGFSIGWITGINIMAVSRVTSTNSGIFRLSVGQTGSPIRDVLAIPFYFPAFTSSENRMISIQKTFPTPIRFKLRAAEISGVLFTQQLIAAVTNPNPTVGDIFDVVWSIEGYTYGNLTRDIGGASAKPDALTVDPYPYDGRNSLDWI